MAYPIASNLNNQLKLRYYTVATTSSSGTPTSTVVVVSRCKYIGGYFVPNNAGTSTNVTGFDVQGITGATSTTVPTAFTISSGVSVTTSTGTLAIQFGPWVGGGASTAITYFNAGDLITTVGSTSQAGFITHVVQEF
jgi:hypothetical protein